MTAHALLQDLDQETAEPPLFARFRGDVVAVLGRAPEVVEQAAEFDQLKKTGIER